MCQIIVHYATRESIEQMARFTNHETGLLDQFQATLHIPGTKKKLCQIFMLLLDSHSGYSQLCTSVTF